MKGQSGRMEDEAFSKVESETSEKKTSEEEKEKRE